LATKQALTITELKKIADKHLGNIAPERNRSPIYRVARLPEMSSYDWSRFITGPVDCSYVEFRAEEVVVSGLPCTAWFYGDILVKVSV
jgi:hypothetical protein